MYHFLLPLLPKVESDDRVAELPYLRLLHVFPLTFDPQPLEYEAMRLQMAV